MARKICGFRNDLRNKSILIVGCYILCAFEFLLTGEKLIIVLGVLAAVGLYAIAKSNPLLLVPFMICQVLEMIYQLLLTVGLSIVYLLITFDPMNVVQSNLDSFKELLSVFPDNTIDSFASIIFFIFFGIINIVLSIYALDTIIKMYKRLRKENVDVPNVVIVSDMQLGQMENGQISIYPKIC